MEDFDGLADADGLFDVDRRRLAEREGDAVLARQRGLNHPSTRTRSTSTGGDGKPHTVLHLPAGEVDWVAAHVYADDNPSGTIADINAIEAVVTDDDAGATSTTPTPPSSPA